MVTLVLQVLGNSDVVLGGQEGCETLSESDSLAGTQRLAKKNYKKFTNGESNFDFPLIKKLLDTTEGVTRSNTFCCFLLTNQTQWQSARSETGEGWANVVAKDGIWWQDILGEWCQQNQINHCSIPVEIGPEVPNGAGDWDGMAKKIATILADRIKFDFDTEERKISFQPPEPDKEAITIDRIIVQHSSGSPALTGALYLWGIERKLEAINLEFVYISKEELECELHSGTHWQWHLKVPQIRELLKIQDFSGALQILSSHPHSDPTVKENLTQLDRAVSLNLTGRENPTVRDGIIERVAIALWSETAFRTRSQWMHWYLRMAGAFELAIMLLVESRGNGSYQWQERNLFYVTDDYTVDMGKDLVIVKTVCGLLSNGKAKIKKPEGTEQKKSEGTEKIVKVEKIPKTEEWSNFKRFYSTNWQIKEDVNVGGFTSVRNELYHSLLGDSIDELLNSRTGELGRVTHPEHPAQVAVNWLKYIINLAGLTDEVDKRVSNYGQMVQHVEENL